MADDVTVDNGGLTDYVVATDDIGSGRQAQLVKLLYSGDGVATAITADAKGLLTTTQPRHRTAQFSLVTQASAIAANDQLCDELELTGMAAVANGSVKITGIRLFSNNTTQIAAEGWLYQVNPSPAGTNAVHDQSDANQKTSRNVEIIDFSSWFTETSNICATGKVAGNSLGAAPIYAQCQDGTNTTSLWIVFVTRTAVTPGATSDYYLEISYEPGV